MYALYFNNAVIIHLTCVFVQTMNYRIIHTHTLNAFNAQTNQNNPQMGKFSADLRITSDITMLLVSQYYFFFNCARENYFFAEKRADLYIRSAINSSRSQLETLKQLTQETVN